MNVVEAKYNKEEIILNLGELVAKQMYVENESGTEVEEWMEF